MDLGASPVFEVLVLLFVSDPVFAGLVRLPAPGLIGFGAKKHDYQFSISHVDSSGNVQIESIKFINNTPANQFMMELMGLTGLSMGAVNEELQARREQIAAEKAEEERIANLECGRVLKAYKCSWSAYLEGNPSVRAWAEKYPEMAEKEESSREPWNSPILVVV